MKKSLLIISSILAMSLLAGCRGGKGGSSDTDSGDSTADNSTGHVRPSTTGENSNTDSNSSSNSNSNTSQGGKTTDPGSKTVLIYMCGSDLESKNNLASGDIEEILKISGQPDNVNIIIETGGAKSWSSKFGISSNKLGRYHVKNKQLVKDEEIVNASMGNKSTLQSFLTWGINKYPAEKIGLIFWNHGNGMQGVCFDEKNSDDCLTNTEVQEALEGAFSELNRTDKLEWIGYDACLMAIQDLTETNSKFANYMIASQESESGYGWDYDTWIDDLYSEKTTEQILTAIVDGFIEDNGGADATTMTDGDETYTADQTLAWFDLSKASAYKTAWENMAAQLKNKITSSNSSSWIDLLDTAKHFAGDDYSQIGCFDAKDFVNKLTKNSTFNPGSSYTEAVLNAHKDLVKYSVAQKGAGNAYGLSLYYDINGEAYSSECYTSSDTNYTNWKYLSDTYQGESSGGNWFW